MREGSLTIQSWEIPHGTYIRSSGKSLSSETDTDTETGKNTDSDITNTNMDTEINTDTDGDSKKYLKRHKIFTSVWF